MSENPFRATTPLGELANHLVEQSYTIKDALIDRRKELGLTTSQVAERMGINVKEFEELEAYYTNPRIDQIIVYALCVHLSFTITTEPANIEVTP